MDIDRLAPQEEARQKENELCFNCRKPGHQIKACRSPKNKGAGPSQGRSERTSPQSSGQKQFQGNKRGGKQKTQVWAIEVEDKAEQTRLCIQAIINETYNDQSTKDY